MLYIYLSPVEKKEKYLKFFWTLDRYLSVAIING
jgi:hypothetical protein